MLSDSLIRSLNIGDKKRHTDRDGLVLELRPNKKQLKKIFIFRFHWDKKPQTITIGEYRTVGLAGARDIALAYRNMVNSDIDPRSKNPEVEQTRLTFGVVADPKPRNLLGKRPMYVRQEIEIGQKA